MWLLRALLVLVIAAVTGASLLGVRWAVRGNADPFNTGWPLDLWIGSFWLSLTLALLGRSPFAAAFGLFLGLVTYMLADGRAEYLVSSVVAFAVHGLLPALMGALCAVGIRWGVVTNEQRGRE